MKLFLGHHTRSVGLHPGKCSHLFTALKGRSSTERPFGWVQGFGLRPQASVVSQNTFTNAWPILACPKDCSAQPRAAAVHNDFCLLECIAEWFQRHHTRRREPPPRRANTGLVGDPGLRRKEGVFFFASYRRHECLLYPVGIENFL